MKISRVILLLLMFFGGASIAIIVFLAGMNYSGYCLAKNRYLTDEEKSKITFEYISRAFKAHYKYEYYFPYKNYEEFKQKNPDHSRVVSHLLTEGRIPPVDFLSRIGGMSGNTIIINYMLRYINVGGNEKTKRVQEEFYITNCGRVLSVVDL
ncbi:MAG: hypothetical protein SFT94_06400 [Pseudanabaenaceae cyanobacterium bins.68]|nr:hypothetical protein [Pseudanabaenaceae cyanobacterium bins.68]